MARRGGGSTGFAIALVIVSVLFVGTLISTIMLSTEREVLRGKATAAEKERQIYIRDSETKLPWVAALVQNSSKESVAQALYKELLATRAVFRSEDSTLDAIKREYGDRAQRGGFKSDDNMLTALDALIADREKLRSDAAATKAQYDEELKKTIALTQELAKEKAGFTTAKDDAQKKLESIQKEYDQFKAGVDGQYKKLEERIATLQQQRTQENNDSAAKIDQMKVEIENLRKELIAAKQPPDREKLKGPDESRLPDGQVVTVLPREKLVYINRGTQHRLILGMSFNVYDAKYGVVEDEFGDISGKATIEVVSMTENSAVCRIVRERRNTNIQQGDIIANVVYDINKRYRFYVWGDFDIDGVGKASQPDVKRVEMMINSWGGKAVVRKDAPTVDEATRLQREEFAGAVTAALTKLRDGTLEEARELLDTNLKRIAKAEKKKNESHISYDTDFLVLGIEPGVPETPDPAKASDEEQEKFRQEMVRYNIYKGLEQEARELGIPILNQNRFLGLIGYHRR